MGLQRRLSGLSGIILGLFTLTLLSWSSWTGSAQAEGSRELVQNGGNRPFIEWAPGTYLAGIERATSFYAYAKQGETILLGSSSASSYDNSGTSDIVVTSPSGTVSSLDVLSSGKGFINTIAKEQAGPYPTKGGYTPLKSVLQRQAGGRSNSTVRPTEMTLLLSRLQYSPRIPLKKEL